MTVDPTLVTNLLHNQFTSGGLVLMAIGSVVALARNLPGKIWKWFWNKTTVSVQVESADDLFDWIKLWLDKHPYSKKTRTLSASTRSNDDDYGLPLAQNDFDGGKKRPRIFFTPAQGTHFFFYKGKFVWLTRGGADNKPAQGGGSDRWLKEVFTITVFGRNQSVIRELIEECRDIAIPPEDSKITVKMTYDGRWRNTGRKIPRSLDSVILDNNSIQTLVKDIQSFVEDEKWYREKGVPYRRGYLLEGVPGSGKTSTIVAIAGYFKLDLYIINLSAPKMSDELLASYISEIESGILMFEDIDAVFTNVEDDRKSKRKTQNTDVTFSGLLNAIDGAGAKEGRIMFMTTNHKEKLDPALIRPGRIDLQIHFDNASKKQIKSMFSRFYTEAKVIDCEKFVEKIPDHVFSMAQVQQYLLNYKENMEGAIKNVDSLILQINPKEK